MLGRALVLILLHLFSLSAAAGLGLEGQVAVHVGASLTRAQYESDYYDSDSRFGGPGALVGFTSVVPIGWRSHLAAEIGVLVNQRGGETDFHVVRTDGDGDVLWERTDTYDWRLSYLALPFALRYSFSEDGGAYLKAGVELSFLVGAKLERPVYDYDSVEEPEVEYLERDDWSNFNFYDFALLGAAGYTFPVGDFLSGFVELSCVAGRRDVFNPKDAGFDAEIKNTSISLSVGVLLDYRFGETGHGLWGASHDRT